MDRISRFVAMSAIFNYNSRNFTYWPPPIAGTRCAGGSGFFAREKNASVTAPAITAVTFTRYAVPRSLYLMRQSAALLCQDNRSLQTLQATLDPLEIDLMNCHSGQNALELIMTGKCTTLIVDCDLDGAEKIIRMANLLPPEQKPSFGSNPSAPTLRAVGANAALSLRIFFTIRPCCSALCASDRTWRMSGAGSLRSGCGRPWPNARPWW